MDMIEMNPDIQQNCLQFTVPFGFLTDWIKAKTGQTVLMSFVDEKSISISSVFKTTIPLLNKEISKEISIKVSDIQLIGENLQLRYDAGTMMNFLSSALVKILPSSVIERGVVEFLDNSTVIVHLDKVEKAHQVLQHVDIRSVRFNQLSALIDFLIKENK